MPFVGRSQIFAKLNEPLLKIQDEFERNLQIINSFNHHYFSSYHYDKTFLASISEITKRESKRKGLEILADIESEFQNVQISHLRCKDNLLLIIFHIPTVVIKDQVSIYRAIPVYTPIPSNHKLSKGPNSFMIPQLNPDLFAISSDYKHHKEIFTIYCDKVLNQNFCHEYPNLEPEPETSCLSSLFFGQSDSARDLCPFGIGTNTEVQRVQLTSTNHFFVSSSFIQTQIHCSFAQHLELPIVTINQTTRVSIPQGCGIELPTSSVWSSWNFKNLPYRVTTIKNDLSSFLVTYYIIIHLQWMKKVLIVLLYALALVLVDLYFEKDKFLELIPFLLFIQNLNFGQDQE